MLRRNSVTRMKWYKLNVSYNPLFQLYLNQSKGSITSISRKLRIQRKKNSNTFKKEKNNCNFIASNRIVYVEIGKMKF